MRRPRQGSNPAVYPDLRAYSQGLLSAGRILCGQQRCSPLQGPAVHVHRDKIISLDSRKAEPALPSTFDPKRALNLCLEMGSVP